MLEEVVERLRAEKDTAQKEAQAAKVAKLAAETKAEEAKLRVLNYQQVLSRTEMRREEEEEFHISEKAN